MKTPLMVPHADLIDDLEFMQWCDSNILYQYCDVVKWRAGYIAYVQEARTAEDASSKLHVCIDHVYVLVRYYKSAAKKYKAERDAKDSS